MSRSRFVQQLALGEAAAEALNLFRGDAPTRREIRWASRLRTSYQATPCLPSRRVRLSNLLCVAPTRCSPLISCTFPRVAPDKDVNGDDSLADKDGHPVAGKANSRRQPGELRGRRRNQKQRINRPTRTARPSQESRPGEGYKVTPRFKELSHRCHGSGDVTQVARVTFQTGNKCHLAFFATMPSLRTIPRGSQVDTLPLMVGRPVTVSWPREPRQPQSKNSQLRSEPTIGYRGRIHQRDGRVEHIKLKPGRARANKRHWTPGKAQGHNASKSSSPDLCCLQRPESGTRIVACCVPVATNLPHRVPLRPIPVSERHRAISGRSLTGSRRR